MVGWNAHSYQERAGAPRRCRGRRAALRTPDGEGKKKLEIILLTKAPSQLPTQPIHLFRFTYRARHPPVALEVLSVERLSDVPGPQNEVLVGFPTLHLRVCQLVGRDAKLDHGALEAAVCKEMGMYLNEERVSSLHPTVPTSNTPPPRM